VKRPTSPWTREVGEQPRARGGARRRITPVWARAGVVVVDPELREGEFAATLVGQEFQVVVVANEPELFAQLACGDFAVVIVIQAEPGLSGAKLLAQVRHRWPMVQGFVVAGYPDVGMVANDLASGASGPLPWVGDELLALVRDAVRAHRVRLGQVVARADAERALRERERWYRVILEHAADGVLITDLHGDYIEANAAICQLLGYSRDEIMQLNVRNLVRLEPPAESLGLDDVLAGHTLRVRRWLQAKDGRLIPVESRVSLLPDGRLEALVREVGARST
jgi:PAS domain S-box-containing protein